MAVNPDQREVSGAYPAVIYESGRPGLKDAQEDVPIWNAKKIVLSGVIDNIMRKHGAEAVALGTPEDGQEIPAVTGDEVAIIGAVRAKPPMTAEEAGEIGTEICDKWHKLGRGALPPYCDTVHFVPVGMARQAA